MNILQLPIEYLWLTDAYEPLDRRDDYLNKKHYSIKDILFEHPACLTTEESARDQGAAANRQPMHYAELVENQIDCHTEGGILYEYIVFDSYNQAREWKKYLQYLSSEDASLGKYKDGENILPYYIRSYKSGYNNKNKFVEGETENLKIIIAYLKQNVDIHKYDLFYVVYNTERSEVIDDHIYIRKRDHIILYIIAVLAMKKKVIYIPKIPSHLVSSNKSLKYILKNKNKYEIICNINNDNLNYPIINENEPIYFNHTSEKVIKLLRMSENIMEFNKLLKSCALYIQLIRCYFIMNFTISKSKTIKSQSQSLTKTKPRHKSLSLVRSKTKTKTPVRKYYSI